MDLNFSAEDETFRQEVRDFFADEYPAELREKRKNGEPLTAEDNRRWQSILADKGWAAPKWHKDFGGPGWTATQRYIFDEEFAASRLPRGGGMGISMIGPIIGTYGNDEQKERFIPDILHGRTRWCQGYSERGAGSDLANLQLKAELKGDHYLLNGHKIWTSGAHLADWIFCLTRTSSEGKKQEGITFLLFDLKTPGVTIKPIYNMTGNHGFNECFFEDVKVPVENRIGEENKGWTYAKVLLQHERTGQAGVRNSKASIRQIRTLAREEVDGDGGNLWDDPGFRDRVNGLDIEVEALYYSEMKTLADAAAGRLPGPGSSYLKCKGTEIGQKLSEIRIEMAAQYGAPNAREMARQKDNIGAVGPGWSRGIMAGYLGGRATTIFGGSSEVQRNVMAKNVLGL